jgi:SAM-dependent methyltransferase
MKYSKSFCREIFSKNASVAKITPDVVCKLQSVVADKSTLFVGCEGNVLDTLDNGKLYCAIPKTFFNKVPWPKIRPFKTVAVDVDALPFDSETFDVVIVNHYFEFSDRNIEFLNEIFRILKYNGKMITTVINERSFGLFPDKIRSIEGIISDINETSFCISNIWGINKKARLLSYDFDYNQNKISIMLLGLFRLLSDVMAVTADKTDMAPESVLTFKRFLPETEYATS